MKIVWHKHNLSISSSVCSGHPGEHSYEIPHESSSGWENSSGKILSISLILTFSNGDFFRRALFLEKLLLNTVWKVSKYGVFSGPYFLIFERSVTFLQSNYFEATVNFSEQLFIRAAAFFEELLFQNSRLFAAIIFFRKLLFLSKTSTSTSTSWE